MRTGGPHPSVIEATESPAVVRLGGNLYAAVFSLMKLLPARYMIDAAQRSGALAPGAPVIETSSGTIALGLALVCNLRGHPLTIVGDPAIDAGLERRLRLLGATIEVVGDFDAPGGIQGARLRRVAELAEAQPGSYVPGQYDNPDNPASYRAVADVLDATLGPVDCVVGAVGSGGSTGGLARALRSGGHRARLVGVDTPGSIIFGAAHGPRMLRGLGSSIHPGNVDHGLYDDVHWVSAAAAFRTTRYLYAEHGMFVGPTSGAAYLAARWHADSDPDAVTVVLFPDDGYRYLDTVYSRAWLREQGMASATVPTVPATIHHPRDVTGHWSRMAWDRRGLQDVSAAPETSTAS